MENEQDKSRRRFDRAGRFIPSAFYTWRMTGRLQKEQIQFYVDACASFNLRKAARVMTQFFDQILRPTGLRSTQLVILLAAGLQGKPRCPNCPRPWFPDRTTLTRALRPLFKKVF